MPTPPLVLNATVTQGALDPESLVIEVYPSDEVPDLTVVQTAELLVYRANNVEETWDCTITSKTADLMVLTHPYVETDTKNANERFVIYALCSASGWTNPRRAIQCQLLVRSRLSS